MDTNKDFPSGTEESATRSSSEFSVSSAVNSPRVGMKNDSPENDDLWNLLGQASQHQASPFFSRNVLRSIRQSAHAPSPWFIPRWLASAAFAALVLGFIFTLDQSASNQGKSYLPSDLASYIDEAAGLYQIVPLTEFTPAHLAGL